MVATEYRRVLPDRSIHGDALSLKHGIKFRKGVSSAVFVHLNRENDYTAAEVTLAFVWHELENMAEDHDDECVVLDEAVHIRSLLAEEHLDLASTFSGGAMTLGEAMIDGLETIIVRHAKLTIERTYLLEIKSKEEVEDFPICVTLSVKNSRLTARISKEAASKIFA